MKAHSLIYLAAALLLGAGCSTPDYRIKKNQDVFDAFPVDVQALVREGKVKIGFTPDMTAIALGAPRRIYKRQTAEKETEIWAYVQRRTRSETVPVRGSYRFRDSDGRYRRVYDTDYVTVDSYVEYDRLRLEFVDGKLAAIEEVTQ